MKLVNFLSLNMKNHAVDLSLKCKGKFLSYLEQESMFWYLVYFRLQKFFSALPHQLSHIEVAILYDNNARQK